MSNKAYLESNKKGPLSKGFKPVPKKKSKS